MNTTLGGATIFKGSSTADSAILIANGGMLGTLAVRLFLWCFDGRHRAGGSF